MTVAAAQGGCTVEITEQFNELLKKYNAPPTTQNVSLDTIDGFLREAYRINSHITGLHQQLRDVRQAYLSTAQPRRSHSQLAQPHVLSDREREDVDGNAKQMIRELNASIRHLDEAEQLRRETEATVIHSKYARGLGAWALGGASSSKSAEHVAAEGQAQQTGMHRDGVLWLLRQRLEGCCRTQQGMMETRLAREIDKSRSLLVLPMEDFTGHKTTATRRASVERDTAQATRGLTQEQVQMFEEDNASMMEHYESTLDKVRTAEKSILEISELQTMLVTNLSAQSEAIQALVADSLVNADNVGGGNRELTKAAQRPSTARYTFFAAGGLCAFLILWDLVI